MISLQAVLQLSSITLLVSAVLLPPRNVKLSSKNFQHILTWDDPNNKTPIYYKVKYSKDYTPFINTRYCSNLNVARCDLTKDFTDIFRSYDAQVQIFTHDDSSRPIISATLNPFSQTLLGPPIVNVISNDHGIRLSIHPPVSYLWSEKMQQNVSMLSNDVYPVMTYSIMLVHFDATTVEMVKVYDENYTKALESVMANDMYCILVKASAEDNDHSIASPLKCVTTKSAKVGAGRKLSCIVIIVSMLIFVAGLLLFPNTLHHAVQMYKNKSFSLTSSLESSLKFRESVKENNELTPLVSFIHLETSTEDAGEKVTDCSAHSMGAADDRAAL
ncbi:interferon alpha/beta receptor 2-like [Hyperolius riggenbachi]|uniref:interferon alpha/beta receptor 2-like n=1 Tax=Hyperolius riggenbachi TaxID=752182 RepID=UPI0035A385E1